MYIEQTPVDERPGWKTCMVGKQRVFGWHITELSPLYASQTWLLHSDFELNS